tara:strand:- start:827 stop:1213 length:387 start_codon:yes stop_codon:yes gene_type:complete
MSSVHTFAPGTKAEDLWGSYSELKHDNMGEVWTKRGTYFEMLLNHYELVEAWDAQDGEEPLPALPHAINIMVNEMIYDEFPGEPMYDYDMEIIDDAVWNDEVTELTLYGKTVDVAALRTRVAAYISNI